jgi:hypothetical protein
MLRLVRTLRSAIVDGTFPQVLTKFLRAHFGSIAKIQGWVRDALNAVGIDVDKIGAELCDEVIE